MTGLFAKRSKRDGSFSTVCLFFLLLKTSDTQVLCVLISFAVLLEVFSSHLLLIIATQWQQLFLYIETIKAFQAACSFVYCSMSSSAFSLSFARSFVRSPSTGHHFQNQPCTLLVRLLTSPETTSFFICVQVKLCCVVARQKLIFCSSLDLSVV